LQTALNQVDATHTTVKMLDGAYTSAVGASGTVRIHGDGAELAPPDSATAAITINDSTANVSILGLKVTRSPMAGTNSAILCQAGTLRLQSVQITTPSSGVGMQCFGSVDQTTFVGTTSVQGFSLLSVTGQGTPDKLTVTRSRFSGSAAIGTGLQGAATVTNCVFDNTGTHAIVTGGNAGQMLVSVSTFVNSLINATKTTAGGFLVTVSDSVMFGTGATDVVTGGGGIYSYDLLTPQTASVGSDHLLLGVDPKLKDVANGDFHLTMTSPAIDAADPNTTLEVDFDGNPRPVGTARDLGAYEFKP